MNDEEFWNRVRQAAEKLKVPQLTFNVWRHRRRVPRGQIIPIYQALVGTPNEIPLDQLQGDH